jgi:hypothetical protein
MGSHTDDRASEHPGRGIEPGVGGGPFSRLYSRGRLNGVLISVYIVGRMCPELKTKNKKLSTKSKKNSRKQKGRKTNSDL